MLRLTSFKSKLSFNTFPNGRGVVAAVGVLKGETGLDICLLDGLLFTCDGRLARVDSFFLSAESAGCSADSRESFRTVGFTGTAGLADIDGLPRGKVLTFPPFIATSS